MTSLAHQNDDRFREPGIAAPLTFLIMFVFFIYGALLVGLLGLSNWIIHAWNLTFFINLGNFGVFLLAILIPALWAVIVGICAAIPYYILRSRGHYLMASKVFPIIFCARAGTILWPRKSQRLLFLRCSIFLLCPGFFGQWCAVVRQNYVVNALKNCAKW